MGVIMSSYTVLVTVSLNTLINRIKISLIDIYWFNAFLYRLLSVKERIDTYSRITLSKSAFDYLLFKKPWPDLHRPEWCCITGQ